MWPCSRKEDTPALFPIKYKKREAKKYYSMISGSSTKYRQLYMSTEAYLNAIEYRKSRFKQIWESKNLLEWNYAEWRDYSELNASK